MKLSGELWSARSLSALTEMQSKFPEKEFMLCARSIMAVSLGTFLAFFSHLTIGAASIASND